MQQIVQKLKTGKMRVIEVPTPYLQKGSILVKNFFSLVSAGTEARTVRTARKGYIGKAKERPQQVKQVVDVLRAQGPIQSYRAVMKKLESYSPLGYSCVGEVIAVSSDTIGYAVGDQVACGGPTASHAEVVCVPANLCIKLNPYADLMQASYNTLGAIAMQGVRQSDLRLGETCAIIGLGLLGQISALLLKAAGIRIIGIDIDPEKVKIAGKHCVDMGLNREDVSTEEQVLQFTDGLGCDGVLITAASNSLDPINFAGAISRKKGTIVVVGDVPTGFDREPDFYKKELQVRMSCSYGPGRYDVEYEEKGIDYPAAYVRWTEKRNMQAFQELISSKKIDVRYLTTHTFRIEEAPAAYEMILEKSEPYLGVLIEYDASKEIDLENRKLFVKSKVSSIQPANVGIGFIGAGSYAQGYLLPNIPKNKAVSLKGVMTATAFSARSVAERFNFDYCTTNAKDIIENDDINTIFIATRHDSHAKYVIKALKAGKHVFVEKPLCLKIEELEEIRKCYLPLAKNNQLLMVGYNRRFSPFIQKIKGEFGEGPVAMIYRVNAGTISKESWINDTDFGGGRIIGEVCHFVDTLTFLSGSLPVSVYANSMTDPGNLNDTVNISLRYKNGSIGTISYLANGNKRVTKERIEFFAHGKAAILDDFKNLTIYSADKKKKNRVPLQDKGQKEEVVRFIEAISKGKGLVGLISFQDIYNTSLATYKILESIRLGACIKI